MSLTSIGSQKTPGRPIEVTFAAETGLPSDLQEVLLIGRAASGATGTNTVIAINSSGDLDAATIEANAKFGSGSEMAKMVIAAVKANVGKSTVPKLKACPLASTAVDLPLAAQTAIKKVKAEFVVSPYDGMSATLRNNLRDMIIEMSGASRVENGQYGSFGVVFSRTQSDPSTLTAFDTQFVIGCHMYDSGSPTYSVGEQAAACAAVMAANGIPFNSLNDEVVLGMTAPASQADWLSVGAGLQSETVLTQGWTPLRVMPNGDVAFVRTVTGRVTTGDGVTAVTAYQDVQDFQILYYWRKTLKTRFSQPDFKQRKLSDQTLNDILAEAIRLATTFQDQGMFQHIDKLAKYFLTERNVSDRSRADLQTPVNVVPNLHVIATNVVATTQFDTVTV